MRTTVILDDDLVEAAQDYTGVKDRMPLLRKALRALIHLEASQRLAVFARDHA